MIALACLVILAAIFLALIAVALYDEAGNTIDRHVEAAFNRWADEAVALTEEERT